MSISQKKKGKGRNGVEKKERIKRNRRRKDTIKGTALSIPSSKCLYRFSNGNVRIEGAGASKTGILQVCE